MSDTVVNDTPETSPDPAFFLDGDAPRLGAATTPTPTPVEQTAPILDTTVPIELPDNTPSVPAPTPIAPTDAAPTLSVVSPVLTSDQAPTLPAGTPNHVPLSTESSKTDETDLDEDGEPRHPMAHLMPSKSKPTEASLRAAEIRAAQKAKGKKIKIGIAVGSLVFAALVGPPLFKWLSNALNEAGNVSTEQTTD